MMEGNLHDIDLIQRYLDRSLSDEEKRILEKRLTDEPALKVMYHEHQQLIHGIRYANLQHKLQQLRAMETSLPALDASKGAKQVWLFSKQGRYAIAASLVLMAALVFGIVRYSGMFQPKELYAAYFEPFDSPGSGLTRGSENELSLKQQAYEAYDAGNYEKAAFLFEQLLPEADLATIHLCLASSYMSMGRFDQAETTLLHMLKVHSELVTQTKWYLALTYLKQGKLEKTKASLWEISDSSTYGEKAKKLLNELD